MKQSDYDISIIVPVYNVESYLRTCLDSLIVQTYDFSKMEVITINDGSTDGSLNILQEYHSKYENIIILDEENSGLSETRNKGMRIAKGKYILFLDSDDTLTPNSIENLIAFFDKHFDEVDLVSYKIIPMLNGEPKKLHYRYNYLTKTGVYDLRFKDNWYVCITTMNYCIKNEFENNIMFDTTPGFRHEDQKFSMDIIKKKLKIGYVAEAEYLYLQQPQSITKTWFHAYYLFDKTMNFWEEFFNQYDKVPEYFQALFINDINWKFRSGILLPYHFEGQEYNNQVNRIKILLKKTCDDVLLNHPAVDKYHKHYFLDLKNHTEYIVHTAPNGVALLNGQTLLYADFKIDISVHKLKIKNGVLKMLAYLKSPIFLHATMPQLYMIVNNERGNKKEIPLRESSFSYYASKEKCAKAYLFELNVSLINIEKIKFYIKLNDELIEGCFMFPLGLPLSDKLQRYQYYRDKYFIEYNKLTNEFLISENIFQKRFPIKVKNFFYFFFGMKKKLLLRFLAGLYRPKKEIWLYYDCKGVKRDNAYFQFVHDINQKDNIKRYYVSNNNKKFTNDNIESKYIKNVIYFKSLKHYIFYLNADKVITAFIEPENCLPFGKKTYTEYLDIAKIPEIIYLQHGVLHAHMPWKYSLDRLLLDREVVSTHFEVSNLISNYCFTQEHIIAAGMPRYDYIDNHIESKKKILYAPSWRSYLVGKQVASYASMEHVFIESEFFKESYSFLKSPQLIEMLETYDYELNFKLHPIFKKYKKFYKDLDKRIKINEDNPDSDYRIFITYFSSYVFDFVYLKRAIIYFVPDYIKFKSGMNLYREVDLKFEDGLGDFCQTSFETLQSLEELLRNNGMPKKPYLDKMNNFFIYDDYNQCKRIYNALINKELEI